MPLRKRGKREAPSGLQGKGRSLATPPLLFISSPMSLQDKSSSRGNRRSFLLLAGNGSDPPVRHVQVPLAATRRHTNRIRSLALVITLLKLDPLLPNSHCGNSIIEEALPNREGFPSPFRECDHLFVSLAFFPFPSLPPSSLAVSQAARKGGPTDAWGWKRWKKTAPCLC